MAGLSNEGSDVAARIHAAHHGIVKEEIRSVKIGEAARTSGLPTKMIRYYEAIGLLPAANRRPNGYRNYALSDINRLRFIRLSRYCGFSLADTRAMLELAATILPMRVTTLGSFRIT